jgi:hypothetical protein
MRVLRSFGTLAAVLLQAAACDVAVLPGSAPPGDAAADPPVVQPLDDAAADGPTVNPLDDAGADAPTVHPLDDAGPPSAATSPLAQILGGGSCSAKPGDASLTAGFATASEIAYFVPYGMMTGAHITPVDHGYIYYPSMTPRAATDYPILSPGDGYVRNVQKLDSDYRVVIEHSCDVWSIFIHLQTLTGPLASLNGQVTFQKSWSGSIPVKAAETIATDGAQPGYDYSLHDSRVTLSGLRTASYAQAETWKPHTVDPFDYIPEPKKSELLAKNLRAASPRGGKIDFDAPGKATGNWFVVGTNGYAGDPKNNTTGPISPNQMRGYWDTHLALAPNAIDPTHFMASVGNYGGTSVQYALDQDPAALTTASGAVALKLYTFEYKKPDGTSIFGDPQNAVYASGVTLKPSTQVMGVLLVQLQADGTLKVEKRPGASASTSTTFGVDTLVYEH